MAPYEELPGELVESRPHSGFICEILSLTIRLNITFELEMSGNLSNSLTRNVLISLLVKIFTIR